MDGGAPESSEGGGWWITMVLWTIVLFGSFLLNGTLLFAFLKRPGLRTISNRFVMNLIASNLLTCVILTPLLMLDTPPTDSFGSSLCSVSEGAGAFVTASSILSVLLIAIDQYFAVVDPLRYRTRIDKLKCGVLIVSVWLVSVLLALLAAFNPHPHSLWLACLSDHRLVVEPRLDMSLASTISIGNGTEKYDFKSEVKVTESNGSSVIEENVRLTENSTMFLDETFRESFEDTNNTMLGNETLDYVTYGLAYATFYTLFVYLMPFVGVCWMYVSIYSAAHKNSERARRTGSGPMLSSPSFCEEYGNVRHDFSTDDFRRIPKISSLSSIDESIETSPSHILRGRSEMMLCSSAIAEEPSSGVVFTVGLQKVDVSPKKPAKTMDATKEISKVPISALRAEFLTKKEDNRLADDNIVRSKFRDRPDNRRKSSHDILCQEILRKNLDRLKIPEDSSGESSANEEEDQDEEEMLKFSKNRRLEDIEVAECHNTFEDRSESNRIPLILDTELSTASNRPNKFKEFGDSDRVEPDISVSTSQQQQQLQLSEVLASPDIHSNVNAASSKMMDTVQSSSSSDSKMTCSGILSRAALEIHNAKSRLQNSLHTNGKSAINARYLNGGYHRPDGAMDQPEDILHKSLSGHNFLEAESSLLGSSANGGAAPTVTITPPHKIPLHRVSSVKSTSSYINSLKYRISNASVFRYREETRAARISALVIVMGLICWTPYVVLLIVRNIEPLRLTGADQLPHNYDVMALSFLILAAYVSPLLFGYRSRRVKRELRKVFCPKRELSYKNNRSLMAKKVLKRRPSSNLSHVEMDTKYNIFSCVYGRNRWPKDKVQFMQVPETAFAVETCRSSFSSGASTQISTTSTEES
ncbi:uncharacterized protein [Neodiprion pinetum]|uniref:uncharacterized protein n=1 Tax=Neodiprion pinetum TaxID=441929 RepID=UPI00076FBC8A|nr:uncharacterized protein LOC124214119 [Neodiprion pinetum]